MGTRTLFCYAEGRGSCWEAFCVDLDIAVQGQSFNEVYQLLNEAIEEYVEYVLNLPEHEQKRFLRRRMPFFERLKIRLKLLFSTRNRSSDEHFYTMHCPA